jgi:LuxR family transcriptional regulator, maltose regulon positive regulatory protein
VADRDQRQAQVANLLSRPCRAAWSTTGPAILIWPLIDLFNLAPAQAARLALAQGRVANAARWIRNRGLGPEDELSYPREREYLVLARVLVASQTPERALRLLERLGAAAAAEQRIGSLIEIRVVQALARAAAGDQLGGLAALAEAVTLGAGQGYVRVFADEGAPMAALLGKLRTAPPRQVEAAAGIPPGYLARLAGAVGRMARSPSPSVGAGPSFPDRSSR